MISVYTTFHTKEGYVYSRRDDLPAIPRVGEHMTVRFAPLSVGSPSVVLTGPVTEVEWSLGNEIDRATVDVTVRTL